MGVSKNEYVQKIDGVWFVLQKEKGVDINSLRLERFILHHLSGAPQDGMTIRISLLDLDGTPMKSEPELLSALSKGMVLRQALRSRVDLLVRFISWMIISKKIFKSICLIGL